MVMWMMSVTGFDGIVMYLLQDVIVIWVMSVTGCYGDGDDISYRM